MRRVKMKILYKIKRAIRNLKDWLPVILKDEQWDYNFTFQILHRKLELKEKFFRSNKTHIADWEEAADEIKEVKDALSRLIEDDYVALEEFVQDANASITREEDLIERDMSIVFDCMKNNIRKWWD